MKQSVQAMEICRRPKTTLYDNLNQNGPATMMANFLPSTTANITLTFNNHLNSITTQVSMVSFACDETTIMPHLTTSQGRIGVCVILGHAIGVGGIARILLLWRIRNYFLCHPVHYFVFAHRQCGVKERNSTGSDHGDDSSPLRDWFTGISWVGPLVWRHNVTSI